MTAETTQELKNGRSSGKSEVLKIFRKRAYRSGRRRDDDDDDDDDGGRRRRGGGEGYIDMRIYVCVCMYVPHETTFEEKPTNAYTHTHPNISLSLCVLIISVILTN